MATSVGVNLRVTGHCNQGGRKYMEDAFVVAYQPTESEKDLEYAFFGIFDGHGGREAAIFAKENLMYHIVNQRNFWSEDDGLVLKSIRDGFITTHLAMWKEVGNWPKTVSGLPSTSGTTSSVAFIRRGKLYIGHVGDSKIVLGYQESGSSSWQPLPLTKDHKPESPREKKRIYSVGGLVMRKAGVERVVWNRPRIGHKGPIRRSTPFDQIPFLAVARSLGDLWSYNYTQHEFVVSPEPDVSVFSLDPKRDRCIVLASDGLWNMVSPGDAIALVQSVEEENEQIILEGGGENGVGRPSNNPSKLLVDKALQNWYRLRMRADNTSVVTVMLDPPGPRKSEVLLRQKIMQKLRPRDEQSDSELIVQSPKTEDFSDVKPHKRASLETTSPKRPNELPVEKKKPKFSESWVNSLPKPVILCPQRVIHHKPKSEDVEKSTEHNTTSIENGVANCEAVNPSLVPVDQKPPLNDTTKTPESLCVPRRMSCPEAKFAPGNDVATKTSPKGDTPGNLMCKDDMFVKENEQNCLVNESKAAHVVNGPSSGRTHLSEVDNIVKQEMGDNRCDCTVLSRTNEKKRKIADESDLLSSKSAADIVPPTLKRTSQNEEPAVPAKTTKLSPTCWPKDASDSCNTESPQDFDHTHNTRSQLRLRKVKVS